MNYQLSLFNQNRQNILEILDNITLEQGNTIPQGYRNNIIWNAGHTLVAEEFLLYHSSRLPMSIPEDYLTEYGSGSQVRKYTAEEFEALKSHLRTTTKKVEKDYQNGLFSTNDYKSYTSEYFGPTMTNIEEAFQFNLLHEGVHFGYILAQLRAQADGETIFR